VNEREFLAPADLHDLTGFARAAEQEGWLLERGIPHKREGKRVIVSRHHARDWLAGKRVTATVMPGFLSAKAH
jgi:hypothetical protein